MRRCETDGSPSTGASERCARGSSLIPSLVSGTWWIVAIEVLNRTGFSDSTRWVRSKLRSLKIETHINLLELISISTIHYVQENRIEINKTIIPLSTFTINRTQHSPEVSSLDARSSVCLTPSHSTDSPAPKLSPAQHGPPSSQENWRRRPRTAPSRIEKGVEEGVRWR